MTIVWRMVLGFGLAALLAACGSEPDEVLVIEDQPTFPAADETVSENFGSEDDSASTPTPETTDLLLPDGSMWWVTRIDGVVQTTPRPSMIFREDTVTVAFDGCEAEYDLFRSERSIELFGDGEPCHEVGGVVREGPWGVSVGERGAVYLALDGVRVVLEKVVSESDPPAGGWSIESLLERRGGELFFEPVFRGEGVRNSGDEQRPVVVMSIVNILSDVGPVVLAVHAPRDRFDVESICLTTARGVLEETESGWSVSDELADAEQQARFDSELSDIEVRCEYDDPQWIDELLAGTFDLRVWADGLLIEGQSGEVVEFAPFEWFNN